MHYIIAGTFWFVALLILASCLIIYFLESALSSKKDYYGDSGGLKATFVVVSFIALYYFFGSKEHVSDIFEFVSSNIWFTLIAFGIYIGAGIAWAFAKWYFYLLNKRDELIKKLDTIHISDTKNIDDYIPSASNNKARIVSWMTYWPFSGLWTLINDPVRRAFQFVYRNVESYFQGISNKMFANQRAALEAQIAKRKEDAEVRKTKRIGDIV